MKRRVTGPGTRVNISAVSARFAAPSNAAAATMGLNTAPSSVCPAALAVRRQ
jgi:hypothetical protein